MRCLILPRGPEFLRPDVLAPLAGHPTLRELRVESYDERVFAAISDRHGWTVAFANYPAEDDL